MKKASFFVRLMIGIGCCSLLACNKSDSPSTGSLGKYDFSEVDRYLENNLSNYSNHVVVLIAQDGQLIYKREINLSANAWLPIASSSKWLSAGVIMSLVDSRQLSLDDTVGKFLPAFSKYGKGNISIRQLFSHTSGFDGIDDPSNPVDRYQYRNDLTLAQAVDSIAAYSPLTNQPGTAFNYGSISIQIAGRIAEVVSGKSWQDLFNERIGGPCQLTAPYIGLGSTASNPLIAGGVTTTAANYLNFLEMIANQGSFNGKQVLSADAIQQMTTDQTRNAVIQYTPYPSNAYAPYPMPSIRYGIGNWLDVVDPSGKVIESSSPGLLGVHPWQDSKHHVAGIIFTETLPQNIEDANLQIRQLVRTVLDKN